MGQDAKIDLEKVCLPLPTVPSCAPNSLGSLLHLFQNVIEIHRPTLPIYQTVIEKTRGLTFRTQAMGAAMAGAQPQSTNQLVGVEAAG
jgi:hypothetical protein